MKWPNKKIRNKNRIYIYCSVYLKTKMVIILFWIEQPNKHDIYYGLHKLRSIICAISFKNILLLQIWEYYIMYFSTSSTVFYFLFLYYIHSVSSKSTYFLESYKDFKIFLRLYSTLSNCIYKLRGPTLFFLHTLDVFLELFNVHFYRASIIFIMFDLQLYRSIYLVILQSLYSLFFFCWEPTKHYFACSL